MWTKNKSGPLAEYIPWRSESLPPPSIDGDRIDTFYHILYCNMQLIISEITVEGQNPLPCSAAHGGLGAAQGISGQPVHLANLTGATGVSYVSRKHVPCFGGT